MLDAFLRGLNPKRLALLVMIMTFASTCGEADHPSPGLTDEGPQWVIHHQPNSHTAVVFVHGLIGDTLGTWTSADGTRFFDLLASDTDIGQSIDIFAFGYPSTLRGSGSFDIQAAATSLHTRLEVEGILQYTNIVFVTHSMGGLVVLRTILNYRELVDKTPLIMFFAVPQEGSEVANLGAVFSDNSALQDLIPMDGNHFLVALDSDWKAIRDHRPHVSCGYETEDTFIKTRVVGQASSTRFCDEPAVPIAHANHISIVKPTSSRADSLAVLVLALKKHAGLSAANLLPAAVTSIGRLETPDFIPEGDHFLLTFDAFDRDVRLFNSGLGEIIYFLAEVPPRPSFHLTSGDLGPTTLKSLETKTLTLVVDLDAKKREYSFILRALPSDDRRVVVRFPDWRVRSEGVSQAFVDVAQALSKAEVAASLRAKPVVEARQEFVDLTNQALSKKFRAHNATTQWVITAEALKEKNWPALADLALAKATSESPEFLTNEFVNSLAYDARYLSGAKPVAPTSSDALGVTVADLYEVSDPDRSIGAGRESEQQLAAAMKSVPSLSAFALMLEGDLLNSAGDAAAARKAYSQSASLEPSPSAFLRLYRVQRNLRDDVGAEETIRKSRELFPSDALRQFEECERIGQGQVAPLPGERTSPDGRCPRGKPNEELSANPIYREKRDVARGQIERSVVALEARIVSVDAERLKGNFLELLKRMGDSGNNSARMALESALKDADSARTKSLLLQAVAHEQLKERQVKLLRLMALLDLTARGVDSEVRNHPQSQLAAAIETVNSVDDQRLESALDQIEVDGDPSIALLILADAFLMLPEQQDVLLHAIGVLALASTDPVRSEANVPAVRSEGTGPVVVNVPQSNHPPLVSRSPIGFGQSELYVGGRAMLPSRDIIDNAVNSLDHTTLVAAVKAAGLVETLKGGGPFTVFAPTNDAFENLPAGTVEGLLKPEAKYKLTAILTYHVVAGRFTADDVVKAITAGGGKAELKTVAGGKLVAELNGPKNVIIKDEAGNTANISTYDVILSNGVIHVIDHVLLPR